MEKLLEGIVRFRKEDFEFHKELFLFLKKWQKPHTLFISCSDSRIDPNMITGTVPGELFIIRNIANIVPPDHNTTEFVATTSAIEYAVLMLEVENIIVCGHSNCGGCAAIFKSPEQLAHMPHTKKWLELIAPVKDNLIKLLPGDAPESLEFRERMMEQENVIEQLKNLMTYSYIRERVQCGRLRISGWYYIIETGEVFIIDNDAGGFILKN